jgi:hypothetical protein
MSDQCLNCGGLIMEPGKTCYCPELPGTGYRRRASDVSIQVGNTGCAETPEGLGTALNGDCKSGETPSSPAQSSKVPLPPSVVDLIAAGEAPEPVIAQGPTRLAKVGKVSQTAEQYTQLLRELDDLLDFLAKEVITLDIVESDKNNGQWPRSDLVKHAREDIAKALQAPTDTERPKCPCGAWYWDEHTMACAIRVSAVATAPAVEKAKYRIRLLEDDNLLLRSRIAEACLHCSPGSVVWEILNPREESRPAGK